MRQRRAPLHQLGAEETEQHGWQDRCEHLLDKLISVLACLLAMIVVAIAVSFWRSWRSTQEQQALEERMHVPFRHEGWEIEELAAYDGTSFPDKPILLAADGRVYNVWRGAHFYAAGKTYNAFAGTDCTRMLAKHILTPETAAEAAEPLSNAALGELAGWISTFELKYTMVGRLKRSSAGAG